VEIAVLAEVELHLFYPYIKLIIYGNDEVREF
jgi:hypothetical protein